MLKSILVAMLESTAVVKKHWPAGRARPLLLAPSAARTLADLTGRILQCTPNKGSMPGNARIGETLYTIKMQWNIGLGVDMIYKVRQATMALIPTF